MYAHLFDHDNIFINKLEAIIDRFTEICGIIPPQNAQVRDQLINIISLDMLVGLVKSLPKDEQGILKKLQDSPSTEEINNFKSKFQEQDLVNAFHTSAKSILTEKLNLIKAQLSSEKVFEIEKLLEMVGKY